MDSWLIFAGAVPRLSYGCSGFKALIRIGLVAAVPRSRRCVSVRQGGGMAKDVLINAALQPAPVWGSRTLQLLHWNAHLSGLDLLLVRN